MKERHGKNMKFVAHKNSYYLDVNLKILHDYNF